MTLDIDSEQYTRMSGALLTKDFYRPFDGKELPLELSLRPPLYPVMLLLADQLAGASLEDGIVLTHLFLALAVLLLAPYALRSLLSPAITVCACGMALLTNKQMIYCHMSEFLSSLFLLGALFSLSLWCAAPSTKRVAWTCFFLSCAILTRLALLPWLTAAIVFPLAAPRGRRVSTVAGIAAGLIPLFLWASFNLYRLGAFSFGAHGGYMYFAAARTLGPIPHTAGDSAQVARLLERFNEQGHDVSSEGWQAESVQRWRGEYYDAYHWNFNLALKSLRSEVEQVSAFPFFVRAARTHSERYIAFLKGGLYTFLHGYAFLIIGCLFAQFVLLREAPQFRGLALANVMVCICSVLYIASVLLMFLWVSRYFTSVKPALVFSLFSAFAVICGHRFKRYATFLLNVRLKNHEQ